MINLIIGLGVLLLLGILYLIFRLSSLVNLARDTSRDDDVEVTGGNRVNAFLFLVFMVAGLGLFFWYSFTYFDTYNPPVASEHGAVTDTLFWVTMALSVVAFVIISIIMCIFAYKFQYRDDRKAKFYPDNHHLELAWTIIPALVLAILIFTGLRAWNSITSPASEQAEVIEIIGQQFAWTARYAGVSDGKLGRYDFRKIDAVNEFGLDLTDKNSFDDFKALELRVPKGKEVLLMIRAKDVLHSVYIPHFRLKMDAVPGMPTQFKFVATVTTEEMRKKLRNPNFDYELACAEICGRGHFSMRFPVVVVEPEEYEQWKSEQQAWLKQNPDYLNKVPLELRETAIIKAGISAETVMDLPAAASTTTMGSH
ncbi:MAG TPA: cytochrome c oxidase subunit II transmembrane domain-containing protein [Cyclobacteriaceae bacterium]|nr:cytochrome c oxidase subunit II transmembrane domain-containing protein [Cyclobacteriaceae bacterium]